MSSQDREALLKWSRSPTLPARVVLRSRIVLLLAEGGGVKSIASALRIAPATVRLWRRRFHDHGPSALLQDAPGRGRKPILDAATRGMLRMVSPSEPVPSVREHARQLGVSASTVSRWRRSE